jgi:DNA/RNA-binding domain of Phe-tRNA-synthetase-like protein
MGMEISLDDVVKKMGVSISTDVLEDVRVRQTRKEAFKALAQELKAEMRVRFPSLDMVKEDHTVGALRQFYWKIGIDPTKTRPSSEALLRRLLKKELPLINNLVDAGNLASAKTIIPIGIYDLDKLKGEVRLRLSSPGEEFIGIGNKIKDLEAGIPVLADDEGVIHLYPHRDCQRTMITEQCENALIVACGAPGMRQKLLVKAIEEVNYYWRQLRV